MEGDGEPVVSCDVQAGAKADAAVLRQFPWGIHDQQRDCWGWSQVMKCFRTELVRGNGSTSSCLMAMGRSRILHRGMT